MTQTGQPTTISGVANAGADGQNAFAAGCAWIEGQFVPIDQARIPILDTGFARSDLTYDVVGVWGGRFFRLDDHLDRFERGCERIRLNSPQSRAEIQDILVEVVRRSGLENAFVEMVMTRGVPGAGERDPRLLTPRLYAYAIPFVWIVKPDQQKIGVDAIVARETRRIPSDSVDPTVKNFHWGDLIRGLFEAYDRGAAFPILTDGQGAVTEGAGYNIFALIDDRLVTPDRGVLEGITRLTVMEIAAEQGVDASITRVDVDSLADADEIFFTSTSGGVMPVASLDGKPVGTGAPGPVYKAIRERYWAMHEDPAYTLAVDYDRPL